MTDTSREEAVRIAKARAAEKFPEPEWHVHGLIARTAIDQAGAKQWIQFEDTLLRMGEHARRYVRDICRECGLMKIELVSSR